jgi:hypothetical protein
MHGGTAGLAAGRRGQSPGKFSTGCAPFRVRRRLWFGGGRRTGTVRELTTAKSWLAEGFDAGGPPEPT